MTSGRTLWAVTKFCTLQAQAIAGFSSCGEATCYPEILRISYNFVQDNICIGQIMQPRTQGIRQRFRPGCTCCSDRLFGEVEAETDKVCSGNEIANYEDKFLTKIMNCKGACSLSTFSMEKPGLGFTPTTKQTFQATNPKQSNPQSRLSN